MSQLTPANNANQSAKPTANCGILPPRFLQISEALAYAGISRSRLYLWLSDGAVIGRKAGKATLIDRESLDRHLDGLPATEIRIGKAA
jgi:hypothetical protein